MVAEFASGDLAREDALNGRGEHCVLEILRAADRSMARLEGAVIPLETLT